VIAIFGTDPLLTPAVIALLLLRSPAKSNYAVALFFHGRHGAGCRVVC
jgi:hypothetical protein